MNINNWLCKYLDIEQKGYVTPGDIILAPLLIIVLLYIYIVNVVKKLLGAKIARCSLKNQEKKK